MESAPKAEGRRLQGGRAGELARRVPLALAIVLAWGIALRVALSLSYDPAGMTSFDTLVYVGMAGDELFYDPARTAGYPMFLRAIHAISADVDVTIALQHLIGIATALLLYATFRRLQTPRWVAAVAAAGVLLSLDQIFLEHSILTEGPFAFLIALVLYAGIRALERPCRLRGPVTDRALWTVAAGLALGLSVWLRPVGVPLIAALALWFAFAIPGPWRLRLTRGAVAAGAAVAMVLAYSALQAAENGYFGLTRATGWALYARTAEIADCARFNPPAGTQELCEFRPPEARPGPDFYAWEPGSPARQLYGTMPAGSDELAAFARTVVVNQPLDYLELVAADSLRYYWPALNERQFGGVGYDVLSIGRRAPTVEAEINETVNNYYTDEQLHITSSAGTLGDLQNALRLSPPLFALATLLSLAALLLSHGRLRRGLLLALGIAALLLFVPPATGIWSARYAVPVTGEILGGAAVGLWLLWTRTEARWSLRERLPGLRPRAPAAADPSGP